MVSIPIDAVVHTVYSQYIFLIMNYFVIIQGVERSALRTWSIEPLACCSNTPLADTPRSTFSPHFNCWLSTVEGVEHFWNISKLCFSQWLKSWSGALLPPGSTASSSHFIYQVTQRSKSVSTSQISASSTVFAADHPLDNVWSAVANRPRPYPLRSTYFFCFNHSLFILYGVQLFVVVKACVSS